MWAGSPLYRYLGDIGLTQVNKKFIGLLFIAHDYSLFMSSSRFVCVSRLPHAAEGRESESFSTKRSLLLCLCVISSAFPIAISSLCPAGNRRAGTNGLILKRWEGHLNYFCFLGHACFCSCLFFSVRNNRRSGGSRGGYSREDEKPPYKLFFVLQRSRVVGWLRAVRNCV